MGEDASLDDFLGGERSEESESADAEGPAADADDAASAAGTEPAAEAETADIPPAKTTYAWDGEGAACEACGETVERRWQQDGGLVCIECKEWGRA